MRAPWCVLLALACAYASPDESEDRRSKLPYIADAVGNTLPPPSNGPATVGSPVHLLNPDRYEFYTFDESGELIKRLMTLEEIQAIVAAGEETEGLVTFANENQPTIAFNFSQPPYTKVHSVVTNVQNVLKAQMEAHKNKPPTQPTLDTPDVSDSWSLILPSIFGNTGVDIVPDKSSSTFTTPDTEIKEVDTGNELSLSKEGVNQVISSSTTLKEDVKKVPVTEKISATSAIQVKPLTTTTTTTTTSKPTTEKLATTTEKPRTTTSVRPRITTTLRPRPITTTTTVKPTTTVKYTTTSSKPTTPVTTTRPRTTTFRPRTTTTTTTTTTSRPRTTTTSKPRTTTTIKPTTRLNPKTTLKPTTAKPISTTRKQILSQQYDDRNFTKIQVQTVGNAVTSTEKPSIQYEKISTLVPISSISTYITERTTEKAVKTTKPSVSFASTTKRSVTTTNKPFTVAKTEATTIKPLTHKYESTTAPNKDEPTTSKTEKFNVTTITTQSVSPTTTVSSTEFVSISNNNKVSHDVHNQGDKIEPELPMFDISQSISQITSDLENYRPIPTTNDLLIDTTKLNNLNLESKENVEIEIPSESEKETTAKPILQTTEKTEANFVKISTLEPHSKDKVDEKKESSGQIIKNDIPTNPTEKVGVTTESLTTTAIDAVLNESMEDLLSQVVNQAPQSIVDKKIETNKENIATTEKVYSTTESTTITTTNTPIVEKESLDSSPITLSDLINMNSKAPILNVVKTSENKDDYKINNTLSQLGLTTKENYVQITTSTGKPKSDIHTTTVLSITEDKNVQLPTSTMKNDIPLDNKISVYTSTVKPVLDDKKEPNYVQIVTSTIRNDVSSNKLQIPIHATTIRSTVAEKIKEKIDTENQKKTEESTKDIENEKIASTTTPLSITKTTNDSSSPVKKIENVSQHKPEITKIASAETNKLKDEDKKEIYPQKIDKIFQTLPKIEEFKKKIQKVNIDEKELINERNNSWKLISTVAPPKANDIQKDNIKTDSNDSNTKNILLNVSKENQGLEITTKDLSEDVAQFTELSNELAFRYWHALIENIDKKRSFVLSPYSITSMLAMMFMGARGATSGEMNEILKLDDMVTFNPHFVLKNISDSLEMSQVPGVLVSAFVRELFSDRTKGKILTFYKERAQHFYNGHVEEVNFNVISDIIRRRTNLLVKRYTWGKVMEYIKTNWITMQAPLAALSVNIFQTDCSDSSVEGRDGEMYFVVSPNVRQRRLVPVPAVVYKQGFLAGYDPVLDATAASLGNSVVSTLFLMPGQQGNIVHADDLEALEKRLLESEPTTLSWKRLLRTLLPRMGLELQIPRFSHKSIFNVSSTLRQMGLKDLFDAEHADLGGLIGPSKDLFLSDMIQSTTFVTCGGGNIGEQHHVEEYPDTLKEPQRRTARWAVGWDEPRDYQRAFHDPHDVGEAMHLPLHLRPRQARLPARNAQPARLKFDRPFLYFVRHNPTGMILYVGRYNPRLLP